MNTTTRQKSPWLATLNAVLWGFLGVRRQSDYESDIVKLNPLHIVAVGILMIFLFVFGLMFLVNWIAG